jgi:tetratricopeptide (TPR) repeat protein
MTRYRCALGAALFRAGQFEEAVDQLTELPNTWEQAGQYIDRISLPYAWFFLAMAHQQLGNEEEAIIWFDKATQWYEEELQGTLSWHRELTLQLFQAEAAQLLGAE